METPIVVSIIGLVISIISVSAVIYFNLKSSRKTNVRDIERQVENQTKVNMKLDEIAKNTMDIKYDISAVKKDVQAHGDRIIKVEESAKQAHHRLDTIEDRLNMGGGKT